MDLTTHYLGFKLKNPFVLGASPLVDNIDTLCRVEDAGAAAVVMHSLFVEQIEYQQTGYLQYIERHEDSFPEATDYFPEVDRFALGPDQYLSQIQKIKSRLEIPLIASLNGSDRGDWFQYARMMEEVGADGLELNLYYLATDPTVSGVELEDRLLQVVSGIRARTSLPLAIKLSPFYSSLAHFASRLDQAGVDALYADAFGKLALTHNGLRQRDKMVFQFMRHQNIPMAMVLGGGYAKDIQLSVDAYVNTYLEAKTILS